MEITWNIKLDLVGRAIYEIIVPPDETGKVVDELLSVLCKQLRIKGFRKGKAPRSLVLEKAGPSLVEIELRDSLHREAFQELLSNISTKAIGPPTFRPGPISPLDSRKPYIFDVEFYKDAHALNSKHSRQFPIMANISGGPLSIRDKMFSEINDRGNINEHLPDEISKSMPEKVLSNAKTRVDSARDPEKMIAKADVEPGKTDTIEKISKTPQVDELVLKPPHEGLDEKAEIPQKDLQELLPKTTHQPETEVKLPDTDISTDAKELGKAIESPSQAPSGLPNTLSPEKQDLNAKETQCPTLIPD